MVFYGLDFVQGKEVCAMDNRKLYRSNTNKKLFGVCGGIGEYFNVDPTLVRIGWIISSLMLGAGLIAYLICAMVMPQSSV